MVNHEYGPFGEAIRQTGPMAKVNPFRFSTKYQDDESDLLYYGYRYYKPSTGTWLSRDPLGEMGFIVFKDGQQAYVRKAVTPKEVIHQVNKLFANAGGQNIYGFVDNAPTDKIDVLGLDPWDPQTIEIYKKLYERLKEAWEVAQKGKCAKDPCDAPTSLSAPCHCLWNAFQDIKGKFTVKGSVNEIVIFG
jgi:RHS repeat-associated protein